MRRRQDGSQGLRSKDKSSLEEECGVCTRGNEFWQGSRQDRKHAGKRACDNAVYGEGPADQKVVCASVYLGVEDSEHVTAGKKKLHQL